MFNLGPSAPQLLADRDITAQAMCVCVCVCVCLCVYMCVYVSIHVCQTRIVNHM